MERIWHNHAMKLSTKSQWQLRKELDREANYQIIVILLRQAMTPQGIQDCGTHMYFFEDWTTTPNFFFAQYIRTRDIQTYYEVLP